MTKMLMSEGKDRRKYSSISKVVHRKRFGLLSCVCVWLRVAISDFATVNVPPNWLLTFRGEGDCAI